MTEALAGEQRTLLERFVQSARGWIEEDLGSRLSGTFGINTDGGIEPGDSLSLSNAGTAVRADLVEIVEYLRSEGESPEGSVGRLVREAAFTHLNRLVAVRVAEAIGLLPETMSQGVASSGFRDFSELAPTVADTEWGRFARFVRLCADELAADVPALFDPRNPLIELEVSESVLARVVEAIAAIDDGVWAAPDTLGWAYQFFNTGDERREMRESAAPRNSRELAVRNQFFTPSYVVEFLVHNGLGAHLAAGFPELAEDLPLLVEVPTEQVEVDLEAVSVLDPACGSGHFLLGAYDVLEKAWQCAGVSPHDAAEAIVRSLWGIDIDPRATQIAQAAVMFRARRHCRDEKLPPANVICARSLPTGPEVDELVAALPEHVGRAVRAISDELVDAPILGPLLKVEERLSREVRDVFGTGVVEGTLSEGREADAENVEAAVLEALAAVADSTTSSPAQRLFAAEAHDAVRFVEAMTRRYTAVLMNPPFGEPVGSTKAYLRAAYNWLPASCDLVAAFVGRGVGLAVDGFGTCSALTNRTGLFIRTFEQWRRDVLHANELVALCDLGLGVMEQALVESASYVVRHRRPSSACTYIRLMRDRDRPAALALVVGRVRSGIRDGRVFHRTARDFEVIPSAPICYWLDRSLSRAFAELPSVAHIDEVRTGLSTGDDFRFARAFWEVDPVRIGYTSGDVRTGRPWVPFAKGGSYSPYWADIHLVVDWTLEGEVMREVPNAALRNTEYYFEPGLTWTKRTASGFAPRLLPAGCIPNDKGNLIRTTEPLSRLGFLTSRFAKECINLQLPAADETTSGGASKSYEIGVVGSIPLVRLPEEASRVVERMVRRRRAEDLRDEVSRSFVAPAAYEVRDTLGQLDDGLELEHLVRSEAELGDDSLRYLDTEIGPYPLSYPETDELDERIADLYQQPIADVIDGLIEERGGSRAIANLTYVADRRVEVIAHGLEVSPRSIVRVVEERGLSAPGEREDRAFRLVSYLVGVAFGRWDVRIGRDPESAAVPDDLLAPPARYSPGTLLVGDSQAAVAPPDSYLISFPTDGVLVDQPGHERDLAAAVVDAGVALTDSEEPLGEALAALMKRPSLPGFLRTQFFKHHLSMYSMSRRKAPIYWQLQVPSKTWGLWLYAPKLSREMLFAVVRETEQRQRLAEQQITHLQREAETGSGGRKAGDVAKELEAEQTLAVELEAFRAEAERIANLGWEPDLDDGMVLNAAPLADLFPAWKDAAKYRKELRAGKYEWATVARYADEL